MQLAYGSYQFTIGATKIGTKVSVRRNGYGRPFERTVMLAVKGTIFASGQTASSTAQNALMTALATPYQDLILYQDDGSESATVLKSTGSISGVRIIDGPHFLGEQGFEYGQGREFEFKAEAVYPFSGTDSLLLSFREQIEFHGGGPLYTVRPAKRGPAQRQQIYQQTAYVAIQTGEAYAYRDYPANPRNIWPAKQKQAPIITLIGGTRVGESTYENFGKSWRVIYESEVALAGSPTLWVG